MIKLIATDLDGTLLDPKGNLPPEIFPLVRKLTARGVLFAVASGRQYKNLENTFAPVKDDIAFICENGALVKYRGETLASLPLATEKVVETLSIVRETDGCYPILCGADVAYIEDTVEPFFTRTTTPYSSYKLLSSLDEAVYTVPCCKISVFSTQSAEKQGYKALNGRVKNVKLTLSGGHWCDVSDEKAHKGTAIRILQEKFGIKREESLAFGDHMNDKEMLQACAHTAAPKTAYPLIKAQVEKIIPSNAEEGVLKALAAMLENEKGVWLWTKNL